MHPLHEDPSPDRRERPHARCILLAEDDRELRWLISHALRRRGMAVVEVSDGSALIDSLALALSDASSLDLIDLIVSDVRMPGWSGIEVLATLSSIGCRTPVVLITAFGDENMHAAAKRLGAVTVIDKPFDVQDLCNVIESTLADRETTPALVTS